MRQRLRVYRDQTAPLIELYHEAGLLRSVNGFQAIDEVANGILAVVEVTV
jgi:adenylate kinase family enzyme